MVAMREKWATLTWRPTNPDGSIGDPVELRMLERDVEEMRAWWRRLRDLPTGAAKAQGLVELRFLMDMFAAFPGTTSVVDDAGSPLNDPLNDHELGDRLRDDAIQRVERAADPAVKDEAERAVRAVAAEKHELTSDDVWERMRLRPEEPRMLGPVMKNAERRGLIQYTDRTQLSSLAQNHRRPVRVWRSLIFEAQQQIA